MIIDACMFGWENDILEIRLNELRPIVDKFVIVEALEYHGSCNIKPRSLNHKRFKDFDIEYVLLPQLEPEYTDSASGWKRENFHRNSLMDAVLKVSSSPNDIVIISDCDEIPRMTAIRDNLDKLQKGIHQLSLDMYFYKVNNFNGKWARSSAGTLRDFQRAGGFQVLRDKPSAQTIPDAGWHFSYFGSPERIRTKVSNFAHSSDSICTTLLSQDDIAARVATGKDLYQDRMLEKRSTNDPRLPEYFRNNLDRFPEFWS
jgi:beta-1,4-mannosyl-glycoprotein beta-1,4-N-acetylglucosaminyltransferase